MPQTFQVLRCYKCFIFQIHQTKKSNKWECKLCGEKQSIKRHYGIGSGKDCRKHVQKLNIMQGENGKLTSLNESESDDSEKDECSPHVDKTICQTKESKWSNYIITTEEITRTDEPMYFHDQKVVSGMPKEANLRKSKSQNYEQYQHSVTGRVHGVCDINGLGIKNENEKVNSTLLDNTTSSHSEFISEKKSHICKSPLNNKNNFEDENQFQLSTQSSIIQKNTEDKPFLNISSNIQALKQFQTSSKERKQDFSMQKIKKSKWNQFIENKQNILDDLCETNNTNCSSETTPAPFKTETEKQLNARSFDQDSNLQPISNLPPNISKSTIFSMSNDCDLDNILNY